MLPLDLNGPFSAMEEAAAVADQAFDGAGVDFLVHNAGEASWLCARDVETMCDAPLSGLLPSRRPLPAKTPLLTGAVKSLSSINRIPVVQVRA